MCGNIGNGKSTLVEIYQKVGFVVIARDALRYGIGGGNYVFNLDYEPIIWDIGLKMYKQFLNKKVNIIVDEVGINKSLRARYISKAKKKGYEVIAVKLKKLSKKESVDRRMKNPHGTSDRKVWNGVWEKFDKMYEEPSLDEGIDRIIQL